MAIFDAANLEALLKSQQPLPKVPTPPDPRNVGATMAQGPRGTNLGMGSNFNWLKNASPAPAGATASPAGANPGYVRNIAPPVQSAAEQAAREAARMRINGITPPSTAPTIGQQVKQIATAAGKTAQIGGNVVKTVATNPAVLKAGGADLAARGVVGAINYVGDVDAGEVQAASDDTKPWEKVLPSYVVQALHGAEYAGRRARGESTEQASRNMFGMSPQEQEANRILSQRTVGPNKFDSVEKAQQWLDSFGGTQEEADAADATMQARRDASAIADADRMIEEANKQQVQESAQLAPPPVKEKPMTPIEQAMQAFKQMQQETEYKNAMFNPARASSLAEEFSGYAARAQRNKNLARAQGMIADLTKQQVVGEQNMQQETLRGENQLANTLLSGQFGLTETGMREGGANQRLISEQEFKKMQDAPELAIKQLNADAAAGKPGAVQRLREYLTLTAKPGERKMSVDFEGNAWQMGPNGEMQFFQRPGTAGGAGGLSSGAPVPANITPEQWQAILQAYQQGNPV